MADKKMEQWLQKTDPANPKYQSMDELSTDQINLICELKGSGALLREITHRVDCSLACVFEVLNAHHLNYWAAKREAGHSGRENISLPDSVHTQDEMTLENCL